MAGTAAGSAARPPLNGASWTNPVIAALPRRRDCADWTDPAPGIDRGVVAALAAADVPVPAAGQSFAHFPPDYKPERRRYN